MTRPTSRRAAVVAVAAACIAATALPALASTTPVVVTTTGGSRNFSVTKVDDTALITLDFAGPSGQLPFKVKVADQGVPLLGNDYHVTAQASNLYYQNSDGSTDYTTKIPSSSLSLGYAANPLGVAGLQLPVVPSIALGGTLSCSGLDAATLIGALLSACTSITNLVSGGGSNAVSTVTTAPAQVVTQANLLAAQGGSVLDLSKLPLAITGASEGGSFVSPAKLDAGDPETGTGATSKSVMRGTNNLGASTLTMLSAALTNKIGSTPLIPSTANPTGTLLSAAETLTAISQQPALASAANDLKTALTTNQAQVLTVLSGVTATLQSVASSALSGMTGDYYALPILAADTVAMKPGTYKGALIVDFFQP